MEYKAMENLMPDLVLHADKGSKACDNKRQSKTVGAEQCEQGCGECQWNALKAAEASSEFRRLPWEAMKALNIVDGEPGGEIKSGSRMHSELGFMPHYAFVQFLSK